MDRIKELADRVAAAHAARRDDGWSLTVSYADAALKEFGNRRAIVEEYLHKFMRWPPDVADLEHRVRAKYPHQDVPWLDFRSVADEAGLMAQDELREQMKADGHDSELAEKASKTFTFVLGPLWLYDPEKRS